MWPTQLQSTAVATPNRSTTLALDVTESVLIEPGINMYRSGCEIAKRGTLGKSDISERLNMRFWGSGCWTLQPLQYDFANIQESNEANAYIIRLSEFNSIETNGPSGLISMLVEAALFTLSDMVGASYSANVPTVGDYHIKKQIPASGSSDPSTVPGNAGFDAVCPLVPYPNADIPMDRVSVSKGVFPANQGFFLRWFTLGSLSTYNRYIVTFYFGQYALVIGNGVNLLYEYCQSSSRSAYRWVQREQWTNGLKGAAPATSHGIGIFPHRNPQGKSFIAFTDIVADNAPVVNLVEVLTGKTTMNADHWYVPDTSIRNGDIDPAPGAATMANNIRFDLRRDGRASLQVSTLAFQQSGTLIDDATIAGGLSWSANTNPVVGTMTSDQPSGSYTISSSIIDDITGETFVTGDNQFPKAQFEFISSDGNKTPVLWAYSFKQAPLISTSSPGSFTVSGKNYNINFAAGDPQTETATISGVIDRPGQHTRLQKRERFSALLSTTYTPPGQPPVNVVLSNGVITANRSVRKGVGRTGVTGEDPAWREYSFTQSGQWDRLKERVEPALFRVYAVDPTTPDIVQPWKVTDALADILAGCGYLSSQINIPDLPVRLWQTQTGKTEDVQINPTTNLADTAVRLCRDYLGAYLHYEANAGPDGQWILIFGTQPNEDGSFTPIYNFQQGGPSGFAPPTSLLAYAANTTFYTSNPTYVNKRPDANEIVVLCPVPTAGSDVQLAAYNSACNPLSFAVPGMSTAPDPDHPDYLGYCKKLIFVCPQLYVPEDSTATNGYPATQAAVNWTTRRFYDFLCHGQRIATINAPLVFVYDSTIASGSSGGYRPLRFQDPVSIDGDATWLVKSVKAAWTSDSVQMATYELIQPYPGQFFFGFDGREEIRRLRRLGVGLTTGMGTYTSTFGLMSSSPQREMGHIELPVVAGGLNRLQSETGAFVPIAGYNTSNGSAG